jgi:hypothetical protein
MPEIFVHALSLADPGDEDPAVTRERLRERFPKGATRRMTQLGLLVGAALDDLVPRYDDAVVYATGYGESRTLEAYLDSFPAASPTLFQTSIHPSAIQQAMITRQHPVGEFFPLCGRGHLVAQAIQTAMLSPAPRVLLCGGEERGTWLLARGIASPGSFAFALGLTADPEGALARLGLARQGGSEPAGEFSLAEFFAVLTARQPLDRVVGPGQRLILDWS